MEYILELFMLQRAYRVSEFLLLIWISSFQFCLQKHLSPIDLKIAYSFIFSKVICQLSFCSYYLDAEDHGHLSQAQFREKAVW